MFPNIFRFQYVGEMPEGAKCDFDTSQSTTDGKPCSWSIPQEHGNQFSDLLHNESDKNEGIRN